MSSRPGVAIVGAGPAGLVVAHLLQREAIPFVIFERQTLAELARRPKAGLVEYRTVQLLAREGIAGSILQFTTENHRSEFRTPDESVLLDYAALTSGRPHYIYPQHELVQRLCKALSAAGGEVRSAAVPGGFSRGLRHGWIAALQNDPLFARWFAHAYAGVDPD